MPIGRREIEDARKRIAGLAHRTPVMTSATLATWSGANLFFKCENFQRVGAFKFRGACNAVMALRDSVADRGVATHSSGNHGQALALAASLRRVPAHIVMPRGAPKVKSDAVRGYGGHVVWCDPTLAAREAMLEATVQATGATVVHPYEDPMVIAGQATAAMELCEEVPELDVLVAPVGGGGLLSGTALAAHLLNPECAIYGAEPKNVDDAYQSLQAGRLIPVGTTTTIADGLRTSLGKLPFSILQKHATGIVCVTEEEIEQATRHVWERMKIIIEPSSAVAVAAVLSQRFDVEHKNVGIIVSGGNVDFDAMVFSQAK